MCLLLYIALLYLTLEKEKPTLKDINDYVVNKWSSQWKQLGRQLNIDQNFINILQHDHGSDCVECCTRMLEAWLEQNKLDSAT